MYVKEAHRQLYNREFQQPLTFNPIESLKIEFDQILGVAKENGWISVGKQVSLQ